jgi:hypothetical protein
MQNKIFHILNISAYKFLPFYYKKLSFGDFKQFALDHLRGEIGQNPNYPHVNKVYTGKFKSSYNKASNICRRLSTIVYTYPSALRSVTVSIHLGLAVSGDLFSKSSAYIQYKSITMYTLSRAILFLRISHHRRHFYFFGLLLILKN